jgi:hypothetical protein
MRYRELFVCAFRVCAIALALGASGSVAWAQARPVRGPDDFLEPGCEYHDPGAAETEWQLGRLLFRGQPYYRRVQMVTLSSHAPESVVFLKDSDFPEQGTCSAVSTAVGVVLVQPEESLGVAVMRRILSGRPDPWNLSVPIHLATAMIDCATAQLLDELWQSMVDAVRYRPSNMIRVVSDGTLYAFMTWRVGVGPRSGEIISPVSTTLPGRLVQVGNTLTAYVKASPQGRGAVLALLVARARSLLRDAR